MRTAIGFGERAPAAAGFSLVELLVVIAVIAVLGAIAFPEFQYLTAVTRTKSASTNLFLALNRARSEAVKRNAAVTITPTGGDWHAGWEIRAGGTLISSQGALKGVTVASAPATVVYVSSGRIQGGAPTFEITDPKRTDLKRCVTANTSGRPYVKAEDCTP